MRLAMRYVTESVGRRSQHESSTGHRKACRSRSDREEAQCHGNRKHQIGSRERCVVIQEGGFSGSKNYCITCARALIIAADVRLKSLSSELEERDVGRTVAQGDSTVGLIQ